MHSCYDALISFSHVHMYVCMFLCTYVRVHVCACSVLLLLRVGSNMVHENEYLLWLSLCMLIRCMHTYTCTYIYVYIHTYVRICRYIFKIMNHEDITHTGESNNYSADVTGAFVLVCFGPIFQAANVQSSYCSNSSSQKVVVNAFVFGCLWC